MISFLGINNWHGEAAGERAHGCNRARTHRRSGVSIGGERH